MKTIVAATALIGTALLSDGILKANAQNLHKPTPLASKESKGQDNKKYFMNAEKSNGKTKYMNFGKSVKTPKGENGYMKKKSKCGDEKKRKGNKGIFDGESETILPYTYWTQGNAPGANVEPDSYYAISHYDTFNTDTSFAPGPDLEQSLTVDVLTDYDVNEKFNYVDIAEVDYSVEYENEKQWKNESNYNMAEKLLLGDGLLAPITLLYTADNEYAWGSSFTHIFKIKRSDGQFRKIASVTRPKWSYDLFVKKDLFHGAYAVIHEDIYFSPARDAIYVYRDECEGEHDSGIELMKTIYVNAGKDDGIRGLSMAFDLSGLVFVTQKGKIGYIPFGTDYSFPESERTLYNPNEDNVLIASDCVGGEISNNFAIYEKSMVGGRAVYVTDKCLVQVDYNTGDVDWATRYVPDVTTEGANGRLGSGSGTTPSIMEACNGLYAVIGDGQTVMNAIVFDLADGTEVKRRPVHFGDLDTEFSTTEQSILIHKDTFVVTSNAYKDYSEYAGKSGFDGLYPIFYGDNPKGLHAFKVTCETNGGANNVTDLWWQNVSIPNGITTSSLETGFIYGIGKRDVYYSEIDTYNLKTKGRMNNYFQTKLASPDHLSHAGKFAYWSQHVQSQGMYDVSAAGIRGEAHQDFLITHDLIHEPMNKEIKKWQTGKSKSTFTPVQEGEKGDTEKTISVWTLEAVNAADGKTGNWFQMLGVGLKYNSAYAACQIGPNQEILYGTALGMVRISAEEGIDIGPHNKYPKYYRNNEGIYELYEPEDEE